MASEENYLKRAEKVGLTQAAIAEATELDVQTVNQLYSERPRGPLASTVSKVREVVEGKELEVFDHLLPLHLNARLDRIAELLRHKGFRIERDAA
jgi:transcriptional regulator with XRE-family HTH domain